MRVVLCTKLQNKLRGGGGGGGRGLRRESWRLKQPMLLILQGDNHQNVEQGGMQTCSVSKIHWPALPNTESFGIAALRALLCARCIPLYHYVSPHNTVSHSRCDKFSQTCNFSLPALFIIMNANRSPTLPRPSIATPIVKAGFRVCNEIKKGSSHHPA